MPRKKPKGASASFGAVHFVEGEENLRTKRAKYVEKGTKALRNYFGHSLGSSYFAEAEADELGLGDTAQRKAAIRKGRLKRR